MDNRVHLKLDNNAASSIDAYYEYRAIVGDDDNGKLFTEEEYEAYKKKVLPMRMKNRIYVSWTNPDGMDCKLIGPETKCFCQHRYKNHMTDFTKPVKNSSELKCKSQGCKCSGFHFIPLNGTQPIRCHCKHVAPEHFEKLPFPCKAPNCKCDEFETSFRCACGNLVSAHQLTLETKDERIKRGHPVASRDVPYAALGGLTGMSSLIDGYMRLDDSGIGKPSTSFLEQPSSNSLALENSASSSSHTPESTIQGYGVQPYVGKKGQTKKRAKE